MKKIIKISDIIILEKNNNIVYGEFYELCIGQTVYYWVKGYIEECVVQEINEKTIIITDGTNDYEVNRIDIYIEI